MKTTENQKALRILKRMFKEEKQDAQDLRDLDAEYWAYILQKAIDQIEKPTVRRKRAVSRKPCGCPEWLVCSDCANPSMSSGI